MPREKRKEDDKGNGGGGGSGSSTTTTTSSNGRPSQTFVTTFTTTSIKTTIPTTTITTLVTSIDNPGTAPNTQGSPGQSSAGTTSGGGRITPLPQSLPPSQNIPTSSASSSPSTATASSSSSPSTSRPVFQFNDLANATLCSPFGLSWTYSGQTPVAMTLTVQQSISQSNATATSGNSPSGSPATMRILTTNALSNADNFIWLSVDVMEGWYIAKAFDTSATVDISARSMPFFVTQGSDTSCLLKPSTSTTSTLAPTQSTLSSPSSGSKPSIDTGDIVGITLGVIAGAICLLLAVFTIPRLKLRDDSSVITGPTKPRRPYLLY